MVEIMGKLDCACVSVNKRMVARADMGIAGRTGRDAFVNIDVVAGAGAVQIATRDSDIKTARTHVSSDNILIAGEFRVQIAVQDRSHAVLGFIDVEPANLGVSLFVLRDGSFPML